MGTQVGAWFDETDANEEVRRLRAALERAAQVSQHSGESPEAAIAAVREVIVEARVIYTPPALRPASPTPPDDTP